MMADGPDQKGRARGPESRSGGTSDATIRHIPVLLNEVIDAISPQAGGIYVDGTFGAGGYAKALLQTPDTKLFAIDRDPDAIKAGEGLVNAFDGRLTLLHGPFAQMEELLSAQGITSVDGVMLDLGVSSMQLDEADRGFSFNKEGPLDMRMAQDGPTAADAVNSLGEAELANVLYILGEEKRSRAIAKAIVKARADAPITTTLALAEIITRVLGKKPDQKTHPATRSFQALRLYVNGELQQLAEGLCAAERLICEGGRLGVVTFHSLEDRIVKRFFQLRSGKTSRPSRHMPDTGNDGPEPSFSLLTRRPTIPSDEEIQQNPRARSAKLRTGIRTSAAPFPTDFASLGLPNLP